MNYLKLFEGFKEDDDILICFSDISDDGFEVEITEDYWTHNRYIIINRNDLVDGVNHQTLFNIKRIKECLLFAIPYLEHEYKLKVVGVGISYENDTIECLESNDKSFKTMEQMYNFTENDGCMLESIGIEIK